MEISYDPVKNERNIAERGLSFDRVTDFDFDTAAIIVDERQDYGEKRLIGVGYLDRRLHVLCFVETGMGIRVISFRKANAKEARKYGRPQTLD